MSTAGDHSTLLARGQHPAGAMLGPAETFHSLYQLLIDARLTDSILVSLKWVLVSLVAALALV